MVNRSIKEEKSLKVLFNSFLFRWIAHNPLLRTAIWLVFITFCAPCSVGAGRRKEEFPAGGRGQGKLFLFYYREKEPAAKQLVQG